MVQNIGSWRNEKDKMKYSMSILYYLYKEVGCQVQFTLGGKSPWGLLRDVSSVETPYSELSDVDFSEQPWFQLMCCAVCLLHSHNFRRWIKV